MRGLAHDFRSAWRALSRSPGYAVTAVALLGVGLAASAVVWTAYDAVVLRPLPFPEPERLVAVFDVEQGGLSTTAPPNFTDYRAEAKSLEALAAYNPSSFALSGPGGIAEQVEGAHVTADFFPLLGVQPSLGRLLGAEDARADADGVVLSRALWTRRYGADPALVGSTIRIDGEPRVVVGIAPRGFDFPLGAELWSPLVFSERTLATQRGAHWLESVGRLAPGATLAGLAAELETIAARLAEEYPRTNAGNSAAARPLAATVVGGAGDTLALVAGAVVLALVAACANLASVALARTLGRGRELAVRASLGAAPRRLVGERIAESLLVAAGGALVGSAIAAAALRALPALAVELPRLEGARFGLPAIAAAAPLAGLAGVGVGLAPALVAVRRDPSAALHAGSRALAGHRGAGRLRRGLVVATTALAFVLIAGAALVVRSAERVAAVDPGFASDGRLTFRVALSDAGYPTAEDNARFADRLLERLGALPGVESVNAAFGAPFTGFDYAITVHSLDGAEVPDPQTAPAPQIRVVTPGWFRDHGIPLRAGRELTAADRHGAPPVVVLSEAAAREIVPDGDPLGREVRIGTGFGLDRGRAGGEVVGVVADLRDERLDRAPRPTLYLAYDQFPLGHLTIVVAAAPERIGGLVEPIRRAVAELDAEMPIFRVRSYETLIGRTLARRRLVARLLAGFALATGALAALGLFGVLAAAVVERRRELAVRGALGATPTSIVRLVVGEGVRLAALGVALGLAAAWPLTRYLQSELYELSPHDPATLAAAALGLAVLAVAVTAIPARRAARLDPVAILRQDA